MSEDNFHTSILKKLPNCTVYSTVTQKEDEKAWIEARTRGIGGSDVGAICGVSPYTSARQVYLAKVGMYPDSLNPSDSAKERMHFGHMLEPVVADEYAKRTGAKLVDIKATLRHCTIPWAIANIDRLIVDDSGAPIGILECKTAGEYSKEDWEEGNLPTSYLYQLNWYLWVLGLERGAFACLVGGNKFYYYDVFRNDDLLNSTIIPAATNFWENNVLKLQEPELQAADTDFASVVYKAVVKGSEITLEDDVTNELARTVVECKEKIKELTNTMEEAQNRIKDKLKEHEIGYTQDYTIKWSPRSQRRVDTDAFKDRYPDIYNSVLKSISFRVMTIKGGV